MFPRQARSLAACANPVWLLLGSFLSSWREGGQGRMEGERWSGGKGDDGAHLFKYTSQTPWDGI